MFTALTGGKGRRKIKDIDAEEISIVDLPATRKKFFLLKRRTQLMEELLALLKSFLGELPEELAKAAKGIPEEVMKALKAALGTIEKYKGELPDDLMGALKTLAKYASGGFPGKKPGEGDGSGDGEGDGKEPKKKAGRRLSKATAEELFKALAILKSLVEEDKDEELKKKVADGDLPEDVQLRLEKLDEIEAAEKEKLEKASKDRVDNLEKDIKDLKAKLEAAVKKRGDSQQAKGTDEGNDKPEVDNWTTLKIGSDD